MKAKLFDIETLLITDVSIHKVIRLQGTNFGIIESENIFNAIYLKSGVIIDGTTSLRLDSCVMYLKRALIDVNSLTHVLNEIKISDLCKKYQITYPVNDFSMFWAIVEPV